VAPRAAASKSNRNLEKRVEALSKEVRAMRETLNKLSNQLTKERRTRLIR
jgi:prefoldin subunit 5